MAGRVQKQPKPVEAFADQRQFDLEAELLAEGESDFREGRNIDDDEVDDWPEGLCGSGDVPFSGGT